MTEKQRGRNAALAIAAVVILLGLPLWWKTTETYRAWLPYSQISELDSLQLQLSVEVEVVFSRGTLSPEQQKKVPFSQTREHEHQVDAKNRLRYRYETKYRTATIMEEDALNQPTAEVKKDDLLLRLYAQDKAVYVGQWRTALLRTTSFPSSGSLKEALSALEPQVKQVIDTMSFSHQEILGALSDRIRISQVSKESLVDSMRAIKSSPGYEITFSLLNPDPKSHRLHWDIEGAVRSYILPLLNKLSPIANFSVDSQVLYYAALGVNPRFDNTVSAYTLNAASLAHVINPVEARLGSNVASSYPVLNFLLYVPEAHHSPLFIRDHQKQEVPSNAFHSPRWGGIMVYNVNDMYGPETPHPVHININMPKVMGVFLAQLRLLLGVQKTHPPPGFVLQSPGGAGLADWELDRLMWSRTVENVATATTTITSLAQLLDQISNIVINDNIAQQVSSAVASLQAATAELEAGNLAFALQYSREAILASERAFFDPSLLHLLYFPDDQKFAIYIPLFLPMCVPIVLSLLKIGKDIRQKRADKMAKKD
ncbi:GPI transamidase component PIG-S [Bagarius yarrelli]|uniref:GPI transamidase component PIG-S n=1 Tax=Bagarius yarrelli TaxID=175774 RepID=A0A556UYI9_BAGYA|nr:GPI transamidase component PIG-S [Bagarius yarrelli]